MSTADIRSAFGDLGAEEFAPAYGRLGAITDDTQMTLFTAEGLLRACVRFLRRGICHPPSVVHHALLRWLHTQGERSSALNGDMEGWLIQEKRLFSRRAPGMTCLSALKAAQRFGEAAKNDSKGCGAIMRIAPFRLVVGGHESREGCEPPKVYRFACESARHTHGHPDSTFSSGYFALVIAHLLDGASLPEAIAGSKPPLECDPGATDVLVAIAQAEQLARSAMPSTPETVEALGAGWVAEEALAIALFCALRAETFEQGVRLAVNHSGNSDLTGSLTGQLLGTLWGAPAIPTRWLDALELRDVIEAISADIVEGPQGDSPFINDRRYPGY